MSIFMDRESTEKPKRRTALVAKELSHYNIDITALSKSWLTGEESFTESASDMPSPGKGKQRRMGSMELAWPARQV